MRPDAHPVSYLRRSYVDAESPGDISLEAQRAAVQRLAHADGHNGNVVEYNDWGISADITKADRRTAYSRLLSDMEAGQVSHVYAFDVDRLYRDPRDLIRLQDAAQRHRVKVVTTGGSLAIGEGADPAAEAFAFIGSIFGRMELQKIKKRNRAAQEARRERGDEFGHPPYGYKHVPDDSGRIVSVRDEAIDLEPIITAYREAGTLLGAARLLNERGIPSPKGRQWHTSALTRVIERNWPDQLPRKGGSGKRVRANPAAILSQLVRCRCGHIMTPNAVRKQLYCSHGYLDPEHGRPYNVSEALLMPWVKEEAKKLQLPDLIVFDQRNQQRSAELNAKRQRIIDNYEDGHIDRAERDAKIAAIAAEMEAIEAARVVRTLPAIDWEWPAHSINAALRAMWEYVELGQDMRPLRAVWRVPTEWTVLPTRTEPSDDQQ